MLNKLLFPYHRFRVGRLEAQGIEVKDNASRSPNAQQTKQSGDPKDHMGPPGSELDHVALGDGPPEYRFPGTTSRHEDAQGGQHREISEKNKEDTEPGDEPQLH